MPAARCGESSVDGLRKKRPRNRILQAFRIRSNRGNDVYGGRRGADGCRDDDADSAKLTLPEALGLRAEALDRRQAQPVSRKRTALSGTTGPSGAVRR